MKEPSGLAAADASVLDRWWAEVLASGALPAGLQPVKGRLIRQVARGELPSGPVFVKLMTFPRAKDRLRYLFRSLPGRHEARLLRAVSAAGVPTAEVLAVRTARRALLPHRSLLVLRALPLAGEQVVTLAERAALARRLLQAGIRHDDLNEGNFVRLEDGRVAVIDLQSARPSGSPSAAERHRTAARMLWDRFGIANPGELVAGGLIAAGECPVVAALAAGQRARWLRSRIERCLGSTTGFRREFGLRGIVHRRSGPWPPGRWRSGGAELRRAWLGESALEVLRERPPRLFAWRRNWPWLLGGGAVYIPDAGATVPPDAEPDEVQEGFSIYRELRRGRRGDVVVSQHPVPAPPTEAGR